MSKPVISICIITYNQENYIRECIEGALSQQLSVPFEIIISDDNSTDGTGNICREYALKNNQLIKYIQQPVNKGIIGNWLAAIEQCSGDYIAICEGDDYWTDANKLQKQLNLLVKNDDCKIVFTGLQMYSENDKQFHSNWAAINKDRYNIHDLLLTNMISTCTILFVKPVMSELENWLPNFKIADWPLYIFLLKNGGYACYLDELTSVYRLSNTGSFSLKGPSHMTDTNIEILETVAASNIPEQVLFSARSSLVKWYYSKTVFLSKESKAKELRCFVNKKLRFKDAVYNWKYFVRIVLIYIWPKLKMR